MAKGQPLTKRHAKRFHNHVSDNVVPCNDYREEFVHSVWNSGFRRVVIDSEMPFLWESAPIMGNRNNASVVTQT